MNEYDDRVLDCFLKEQGRLFDEPVAENREEAEEFLADVLAEVLPDLDAVRSRLDAEGMDVTSLSNEELRAQSEVFSLPDGRFLVVIA